MSNVWCHTDLGRMVEAPLQLRLLTLTRDRFVFFLEQFANQARYVKRDVTGDDRDETFCNFFVREVLHNMGVYLPVAFANDVIKWFSSAEGIAAGWKKVNVEAAREMVEAGVVVVPHWFNTSGPGHIALGRPAPTAQDCVPGKFWIAQAGATNSICMEIHQGFGKRPFECHALIS